MKRLHTGFLLGGLLVIVLYNEFLVYFINFISWPKITCDTNDCTKILFIADPQILGDSETFLARFDCDKYLRNTFSLALQHVDPDGVIFLGDLEDEGHMADDTKSERYYRRFQSIFQIDKLNFMNIKAIFLPGDNDLGKDDSEVIDVPSISRYIKYFGWSNTETIKNVRINKVFSYTAENSLDSLRIHELLKMYSSTNKTVMKNYSLNIAVSHIPLTSRSNNIIFEVLRNVKPEFLFSGHKHTSYAMTSSLETGELITYQELKSNSFRSGKPIWVFNLTNNRNSAIMTEIVVPTCNYRMGVSNMGYGVVVYDWKSSKITYNILWLPSRFRCLFLYILFIVVSVFPSLINYGYFRRKLKMRRKSCLPLYL